MRRSNRSGTNHESRGCGTNRHRCSHGPVGRFPVVNNGAVSEPATGRWLQHFLNCSNSETSKLFVLILTATGEIRRVFEDVSVRESGEWLRIRGPGNRSLTEGNEVSEDLLKDGARPLFVPSIFVSFACSRKPSEPISGYGTFFDLGNSWFETHSLPSSLGAALCAFAFYDTLPGRSVLPARFTM
jgi:hypothetical protein